MELMTINENHLELISKLNWRYTNSSYREKGLSIDDKRPFGNERIEEDIARILGWEYDDDVDYSNEMINKCNRLYLETLTAVEICCQFLKFETGSFKRLGSWENWEKV